MTYDVTRYTADPDDLMRYAPVSKYPHLAEVVLAADAEAHEKAAVEAALADGYHDCYIEHYPPGIHEQAIRDCIATLEELADWLEANDQCDTRVMDKDAAIAALRALLEGEK